MIENTEDNSFSIKEQLEKYIIHLRWFVLSILVFFIGAFLYLRYSTPEYIIDATVLIKDDKKGGLSELSQSFSDLGILGGGKSNVDNEIEILKSRTLVENTVQDLELNISYFKDGRLKTTESYKQSPVKVSFFDKTKEFYKKDTTFIIQNLSSLRFNLLDVEKNKIGEFSFGKTIKTTLGNMVVVYKSENVKANNSFTTVSLSSLERVTNRYRKKLQITPVNKMTSVLTLSIVDPVKDIGVDFLNKLIENYNEDAINDKTLIAKNTENFINQRLKGIVVELDTVEGDIEKFKKVNRVTDIVSEAQLFLQSSSEYEKNSIETATKLKVVEEVLKLINKSTNEDLIPANIIPDGGNTSGLIQEYNQLVLDKNRIAKGATAENPMVINLEQQLLGLRQSITESLKNLKSSLTISQNDLRRQGGILGGKIGEIPRQEREAREIGRKQQVKEALYLYLLQKREENAIALYVTAPNSKVIDSAYASPIPVSPKSNIIYLVALLLGLLVPFAIIYIYDLLNTKIKNRGDIEGKVQVPFIGDVPRSESHEELIKADSRSSSAEAMRIIRTNLDFIVNQVPDGIAKTIFMTSTFPKEGKTFISVNLAGTFALSGKKVLLIGLDIRNPKLDEYMNLPNRGVTTYLSSKNVDLNQYLIKQEGYEHFYVLPAGLIPPNPAELLMGTKVEAMFEALKKQFDYIVVDTAPVSLVTDTLLIAKHADAFIYVVRANFLDKRMLRIPETLYRQRKLPNMSILLNDTDTKKGYGYGYGYGVEIVKEPWYKEILNSIKKKS